MALLHREIPAPRGCGFEKIVIRETNGIDEQHAAMQADSQGAGTNIYQELVRRSIVSVDGEKVTHPFLEMTRWNSKARDFVRRAYEDLNQLKEEEMQTSFLSARDVDPKTMEPIQVGIPEEDRSVAIAG